MIDEFLAASYIWENFPNASFLFEDILISYPDYPDFFIVPDADNVCERTGYFRS